MVEASEPQSFHRADGEGIHLFVSISELISFTKCSLSQIESKNIPNICLFFLIYLNSNLYIWKPSERKISYKEYTCISACNIM